VIKFVTVDPATQGFTGRVQVLGETVESGEFGYSARGAASFSLSDSFAVRASGFVRRDPGYIDNIFTGQSDVNRADVYGGHLSTLWRISDRATLRLGALFQNTDRKGIGAVDTDASFRPLIGDLKQTRLLGTKGYTVNIRLYTASLTAQLGNLDFTSVSGYGTNRYTQLGDLTRSLGFLALSGFPGTSFSGFGVNGAGVESINDSRKFTQELRLASSSTQTLEWLAGAFYSHERNPVHNILEAVDPANGAPAGVIADDYFPTALSEYALFADATYHITQKFDVQVGARESWNRQSYNETDTGPGVPFFYKGNPSPFVNDPEPTRGNALTYLLTPRLKLPADTMFYARYTSGYRFGGRK
jgi:iron complex outermembrane recepter protein